MNKKILLITFIIISYLPINIFSQELLDIGDNLNQYLKRHLVKYQFPNQKISKWLEGDVTLYTYTQEIDGNTPVILFAHKDYPIGVLQGKSENAYFLFDLDGDGILDTKCYDPVLPYWVVYGNTKKKTGNNNLLEMMDLIYNSFQSNEGPFENNGLKQSLNIMDNYAEDESLENRDLVYLLYFYMKYNQDLKEISLNAIQLLKDEYKKRYSKIHPLLLLYLAETNINLKNIDTARNIIKELRRMDPDFIPAKVYEYNLEEDKNKAKELLKELKRLHGDHWIVKKI